MSSMLQPGDKVPDFLLVQSRNGKDFTPEDIKGQTTVFLFYPFAFSSVCSEQLSLYETHLSKIKELGAKAVAVSCDSSHAQSAFTEKIESSIPQMSDFEPKGATARAFGVLRDEGFAERAVIIVGPDGKVVWSYLSPSPAEIPDVNLIIDALKNRQNQ